MDSENMHTCVYGEWVVTMGVLSEEQASNVSRSYRMRGRRSGVRREEGKSDFEAADPSCQ